MGKLPIDLVGMRLTSAVLTTVLDDLLGDGLVWARLRSAVSNSVYEVLFGAEARGGDVGASKLGSLAQHVVDAGDLKIE